MSRSVGWIRTDVSGLRICPILKGQDVHLDILAILIFEDGTDT
jgi:hypothetical protein